MSKTYDSQWFAKLSALAGSAYDDAAWLQGQLRIDEEEKERFFDNEVENPLLVYHRSKVASKERLLAPTELLKLAAEITAEEPNEVVKALYLKKIANQCIRLELLNATLEQNDKLFYQLSCQLHGKPKKKYFAYVAKQVGGLCKETATKLPAESKRLKKIFSKIDVSGVDISAGILPPLVAPGDVLETPKAVKDIFQETLDQFNITGWTLLVDKTEQRTRFSVNASKKIVHIPGHIQLALRPKPLTSVQVEALAAHEVGVHARRAQRGAESKLALLQLGLDSYLAGEEGIASYMQQQCEGATEFYGFDRYMAAGLAVGLDGTPRDFRSVFVIMLDYYKLLAATGTPSGKIVPVRAAWDVCVRIFRGTTGQTAGNIYTKDIVYMEGNIGIWHLLSDRPQVFPSLFVGKFNPLLPRHVRSLQTLEILTEW